MSKVKIVVTGESCSIENDEDGTTLRDLGYMLLRTDDYQSRLSAARDAGRDGVADSIRGGIIDWAKRNDARDMANNLLGWLNMNLMVTKYRVTATADGTEILSVVVEADDEEAAEEMVAERLEPYTGTVELEWNYSGEGDVEDCSTLEVEADSLYDDVYIEFTVEEVTE